VLLACGVKGWSSGTAVPLCCMHWGCGGYDEAQPLLEVRGSEPPVPGLLLGMVVVGGSWLRKEGQSLT
jgi:hypothetical protein